MKKRMIATIMALMIMGTSLTAYAAPKEMEDGTIFDAEYYAQNNPDVVAALGKSESAMWQHYKQYGRAEGRKAYEGDEAAKATATASTSGSGERSALARSTKTAENDAVAAGTKLVLPFGAMPSSGTTASGINWASSWYLHYTCAWTRIYDAYSGVPYVVEEVLKGEALSECMNGNMDPQGIEMYLDFGLFTDYVDQLKAKGVIPQSYQLPKTYYTITKTGGTYSSGVYTKPYITTDCPEALGEYNREMNYMNGTNNQPAQAPRNYTPKYLREQQ